MHVAAWLPRAAAAAPGRAALVTPAETLTYERLLARAIATAGRLARLGVGPSDRVGLALPPGAAFVETLHGCWLLGAVPVPVDVRLAEPERARRAAGAALTVDARLDGPEAGDARLLSHHDVDAPAAVVHTSGTTGEPRAIELTFANWLWSALGSAVALGLDGDERWVCALPLAHVGGLSVVVRSVLYGTTAIVHERFDPERVVAGAGDATLLSAVPTMLARLLDVGLRAPRRLRCVLVGGAPLPAPLLERANEAAVPLAQTYGLTEACSQVTTSAIGEPRTAGRPLFCTRVEVARDGEVLVAGATVAPGAGRVLRTGDLGELDELGRLTIVGRRSELIVSGGENVGPAEVEAALESHPAVAEAAVHGRPDTEWGEAVVATVVLRDGRHAGESELREHCRGLLAGFKVPKAIGFAAELPRTRSGKLRREALR